MKKYLALILAALMLLPMLFGCANGTDGSEGSGTADASGSEGASPDENDAESSGKDVTIVADGTTAYKVIRPEKGSTAVVNAAVSLRLAIQSATGADIGIAEDWYSRNETLPEKATEILVGVTNRKESTDAAALVRQKDFIITMKNDRIVITGGSDAAVVKGVEYFISQYVNAETKTVVVKDNLSYINKYEYPLGKLSINGTALDQYRIVYPEKCDLLTLNAAVNLYDYILSNAGVELDLVTDKEAETEYELLIGNTNREATKQVAKTTRAADEYILCTVGNKVVMLGDTYMVAAAAGAFATQYFVSAGVDTAVDVTTLPTTPAGAKFEFKEAKNAILIIGDGMGRNHIESTYAAGELDVFTADLLPVRNENVTKSYSVMIGSKAYTDSAAAGTALACGYKTINGYIGLDHNKKSVGNLRELAYSIGARSSILTTDKITGATPAVFLAHQLSRNDTDEIQKQINAVIAAGEVDYCQGSVGDKLYENTRESLQLISENGSRFFTMIEEAYTDKGGHNNDFNTVYSAVKRVDKCVAYATAFTFFHPDTVLIVTADHETGGITKNEDGTYKFTSTNHTNADVPVYAIGTGTAEAFAKKVDNTDISKFIGKIFGNDKFGDQNFKG